MKREGGPIENVDFYQSVSKDYFATMGIRLMDGRVFDDRDAKGAPLVAIVNHTMANTFWPNQNAIGRRVRPIGRERRSVVDRRGRGGRREERRARPAGGNGTVSAVRQAESFGRFGHVCGDAGAKRRIRACWRAPCARQLNELDSSLPLADVRTMDDVLERAQARPRFLTLLLSLFSAVALAIATVGIYGVVSYLGGAADQGVWSADGAGRARRRRARPGDEAGRGNGR